LAPISDPDPDLVVLSIAHALGVREVRGQQLFDSVVDYLRDKELLLVLDNFEHVVQAAPSVARLLQSCPRLKVLVTSRMPLRVSAEQEYPVPPLSLPARDLMPPVEALAQYEAVALFVARAQADNPSFRLTAENAAD